MVWPIMRKRLNLDKAYLELVIKNSFERRHGQLTVIPGAYDTGNIATLLDNYGSFFFITNFAEICLLSIVEFPLLVG